MLYSVSLSQRAAKAIDKLSPPHDRRVREAIERLANEPRPTGTQKLRGMGDIWRIRVGDLRVLYTLDDSSRSVVVEFVEHRSTAYH